MRATLLAKTVWDHI